MEYDPTGCFLRVGMSDVVIQLYLSAKRVANNLFLAMVEEQIVMHRVSPCYCIRALLCHLFRKSFQFIVQESHAVVSCDISFWRTAARLCGLITACLSLPEVPWTHSIMDVIMSSSIAPHCVPGLGNFGTCSLVELLVHVRLVDNWRRLTAAPSASGSSKKLFLQLGGVLDALVSPFISFHSSFISILDTLNFLHHHNLVTFGRFLHRLSGGIYCLPLIFSDCDLEFTMKFCFWCLTPEIPFSGKGFSYPPGPYSAPALDS